MDGPNGSEKKRLQGRAFVKYRADAGLLSFMKKWSPRLPVRSVDNEGLEFRSIETLEVDDRIVLSLWSQSHPTPARVTAQVSQVVAETRIGEQTYAFRIGVKFVELSSEAWNIISRLSP